MKLLFLLEERSAEALLQSLLPRILPEGISFRCITFEGKQDLEKQLLPRIRGWMEPNTHFIVMRDQDSGDCYAIKARLVDICHRAGRPDTLVRIVCHELESWYLGDLQAVEYALNRPHLARQQQSKKFRDPDRLPNPKQVLRQITNERYQQIAGSRAIGQYLDPQRNCSTSFNVFVSGLQNLVTQGVSA